MTTTARTYADRLDTLDGHRQASYVHVSMGKIYAAAHQMGRHCATEAEARRRGRRRAARIGQPVLIYEMDDRHGERFIGTIE